MRKLHQQAFDRPARRGAYARRAGQREESAADVGKTPGFVRRQNHGEAALGGEQAHDRVAQLVEGQAHGVARRGAAFVGAGQ